MKKYASEFLGTFAIVFCGTGAIIINEQSKGAITHAGIAITFGLIVMAMIYTLGERSGAHFNPAVSIAFALHGVFSPRQVLPYVMSQLAGGLSASLVLKALFPASVLLGATVPSGSHMQSFVLEVILTFFLMLTIASVAEGGKEKGMFAGMAIGSVVLLEAMFAGPVSGASMNPARSFGPAIVSGALEPLWIYLAAPVAGAAAAIVVHRLIK